MAIDGVTIGPFKGGLNNISNSGESADTEVVELINMGLTVDGALTSRLPMRYKDGFGNKAPTDLLGIYRETPSLWYLITQFQNSKGGWTVKAYPMGEETGSIEIRATENLFNKVTAFVQVNDFGYFCANPGPSAGLVGFKWKPGTSYTDIPTMPRGKNMVSFKSRLWITGTETAEYNSRMWFSTIDSGGIKIDTWNTSVDYFDVAPGEGGYVTALIALNSSIVVFKNDGTWRFSFASTPSKGTVDKVSGTIGAANSRVVVEFNNLIYTYDQGKLYELVNNNYSAINKKIEFRDDNSAPALATGTDLSVIGTDLILRYFNALYVFSGETGTWSQWRTKLGIPGKFLGLPSDSNSSKPSTYLASSVGDEKRDGSPTSTYSLIQLEGDYSSTTPVEDIECVVRTKAFDYKAPAVYKRLFWWGIDHKSYQTFTASAIPVVKRRQPTWGELKSYKWGEAKKGAWGNPLKWKNIVTTVSDSFDSSNEQTENGRIFSKIKKSLRFRQIAYEIRMKTQGNASTGPVKIFSLITYVTPKHNVVDKNN